MNILAIETSADETACAVTSGRKVLSNVIYSQILSHKKWGGIYPSLAKRAHEERIDGVLEATLKKLNKKKDSSMKIFPQENSSSEESSSSNILFRQNLISESLKQINFIAVT